nr:AraC family transcriptional regulator [Planctomycetota bacterium]
VKPLATISRELGYCDEFFFGRQFKRVTGLTPARFRREFRGGRQPPRPKP